MSELITKATFDPDNVLLSDAPTGQVPVEHASTIITDTMAQSAVMQLAKYEPMKLNKKS